MPSPTTIAVYGDSLLRGTIIDDSLHYHATVKELMPAFEQAVGASVRNRARFGCTIEKGAAFLQQDLSEGLRCDYALIEFGGNDCSFDWQAVSDDPSAPHQPFTPLQAFEQTCRSMVASLKSHGITPVLMTLPPIDALRHFAFISRGKNADNILRFLGDEHMIYRFHELYSSTLASVAAATGSLLVKVRESFLRRHDANQLVGLDGIHLRREGYEQVFTALREFALNRRAAASSLPGAWRSYDPVMRHASFAAPAR